MPTDTLDIYAPDNAAAWERAGVGALIKVRPGMGRQARSEGGSFKPGYRGPRVTARDADDPDFRVALWVGTNWGRETGTHAAFWRLGYGRKTHRSQGWHPDPFVAICLALCAYRRAVEGVQHGD